MPTRDDFKGLAVDRRAVGVLPLDENQTDS
jgi:hypothetical protein